MGPILWLIAAGILALLEFAIMDFSMLMLATAALSVAGITTVLGMSLAIEIAVFAVVAITAMLILRPYLRRRLLNPTNADRYTIKELEGRQGLVMHEVSDSSQSGGLVQIDGDLWSARTSVPGEVIEKGATVRVLHIDGTTAVIWQGP